MTNLDKDTIKIIKRLEKAVEGTNFEINRFKIEDTMVQNRQMISLDIRRMIEDNDNNERTSN